MTMYGDLRKKLDDSLFVKMTPGHPLKFRLLDHPWISQRSFEEEVIDKETNERKVEARISTQFHWPVWDYEQERVRVLSQGKQIFDKIAGACETWPQGDTMPSVFDIVVERFGTGRFDTKYDVQTVPYVSGCPNSSELQLPDMQRASKGIPVQQILAGKKPPLLEAGGAVRKPTAADALAMAHMPGSVVEASTGVEQADVIPADADINNINLDDIPF